MQAQMHSIAKKLKSESILLYTVWAYAIFKKQQHKLKEHSCTVCTPNIDIRLKEYCDLDGFNKVTEIKLKVLIAPEGTKYIMSAKSIEKMHW